MRLQKSVDLWEKYSCGAWPIPRSTPNISHPTSHTHHLTSDTPHSTFSTSLSACEISVPILRTGGAICVVDKHPAWFLCRSVASVGEIFSWRMAHSPFRRSPCEGHIPHSQHSSPKSTRFFPSRPAPRPNTPFSAHHCNRLTTSHLLSKPSRATFQTHHSPPRNAIFRPTIPALSKLHPLPFAPRSLSPRNPIHAQRPRHPSLTAFPPVPNSPPNPSNRAFPPSVSPKIPTPHFHQISLPSAPSPHRQDDPVECNGVGEEWTCAFPMLIHRRPSCRLEKFLVPLMVSSIQSSTFNHSFLQNLLISNRWFSTVCLSLLTLMYP